MAKGETYEQFVDKFKQKKTTDDCYTPEGKQIYGGAVIYEELDAEAH